MEDYKELIAFLVDVIQYDIRDLGRGFKFTTEENCIDPIDYRDSICQTIDNRSDTRSWKRLFCGTSAVGQE